MACNASPILASLESLAGDTRDPTVLGTYVVEAIKEAMPQVSWVGIYWLQGRELVLGPYVGPATEHERIPVGKGVCGVAVERGEDQLIDDVRTVPHYLACARAVRSELVVLIRANGDILGQIDLDANEVGAFDGDDACVLRSLADSLGGLLETAHAKPTEAIDDPEPR